MPVNQKYIRYLETKTKCRCGTPIGFIKTKYRAFSVDLYLVNGEAYYVRKGLHGNYAPRHECKNSGEGSKKYKLKTELELIGILLKNGRISPEHHELLKSEIETKYA